MKNHGAFVIDTEGWGHSQMVKACRLVLTTTERDARRCETDIPADRRNWPPDAMAVADILRQLAGRTRRLDRHGYA